MAKKGRYNYPTSTRLNKEQSDYLKENGLTLRDTLIYYMENNKTERLTAIKREKYLINHIQELEYIISKEREELKEIRLFLGKTPSENDMTLDIMEVKKIIMERCKFKNEQEYDMTKIYNFIDSNRGKEIIKNVLARYKTEYNEEFENKLIKSFNF